ncbi:MAG TPA: hypothetical protein VHY20_04835 [Pirellulales bacterium]|jgi:hypothetical protein|nr:hypothetical protein [Pirellulales bacterium]
MRTLQELKAAAESIAAFAPTPDVQQFAAVMAEAIERLAAIGRVADLEEVVMRLEDVERGRVREEAAARAAIADGEELSERLYRLHCRARDACRSARDAFVSGWRRED